MKTNPENAALEGANDYNKQESTASNEGKEKEKPQTSKEIHKICEECDKTEASLVCEECEQILCVSCDQKIHNKGARKNHQRSPFNQIQETNSPTTVKQAASTAEEKNKTQISPTSVMQVSPKTLKSNLQPMIQTDIPAQPPTKNQSTLPQNINVQPSKYHILMKLLGHYMGNNECLPIGVPPPIYFEANSDPAINFPITYSSIAPKTNTLAGNIVRKLYQLAREGEIMVLTDDLEKYFIPGNAKKGSTQSNQFCLALQEAEDKEMIVMTSRQFGTKLNQKFASIRLKNVSLESVVWILKSLEKDEMTPIERAVQSRFKESFRIKMNTLQWSMLLEVLRRPHNLSKTAEEPDYEFDIVEIDDSVSGCRTCAIFPKGKRWAAVDMSLKTSDINQDLYKEFLKFLESYFQNIEEDDKLASTQEEKYIPGGRYGCAQFVKACATPKLTACSLGKLAQFIQYAINEDILRYQRTLLVNYFFE